MSSSSSLSNNIGDRSSFLGRGLCYCMKKVKTRTSWTKKNPGRRFASCPNSLNPKEDCEFFDWVDPELSPCYVSSGDVSFQLMVVLKWSM
ncbi:hypothetical protein L1887_44400 [Cichorium endivia]|nr:hypothetical protein L1887_44400 [Cichorium endivia]